MWNIHIFRLRRTGRCSYLKVHVLSQELPVQGLVFQSSVTVANAFRFQHLHSLQHQTGCCDRRFPPWWHVCVVQLNGLPPSPQTEAPPLLRGRSCGYRSAQLPVTKNTHVNDYSQNKNIPTT